MTIEEFGKLISKLKSLHLDKSYRVEIKATSEKQENLKGKYYIVNFSIGAELTGEKLKQAEKTAFEYGLVLDREIVPEEE